MAAPARQQRQPRHRNQTAGLLHRLIRWATVGDKQGAVVDRLFRLYFEEGRDIGDAGVLTDSAAEAGMDSVLVGDLL